MSFRSGFPCNILFAVYTDRFVGEIFFSAPIRTRLNVIHSCRLSDAALPQFTAEMRTGRDLPPALASFLGACMCFAAS